MKSHCTVNFAEPRIIEDTDDCFFYHTLDLPGFGTQVGEWDLRDRFDDYVDHFDFNGKLVLDIGAGCESACKIDPLGWVMSE